MARGGSALGHIAWFWDYLGLIVWTMPGKAVNISKLYYKQNPLEEILIFTIYQNYTFALKTNIWLNGDQTMSPCANFI